MSIQQLVPSKEVCEQLAAAGFHQQTCFYWKYIALYREYRVVSKEQTLIDHDVVPEKVDYPVFAAPTAQEILDRLPPFFLVGRYSEKEYTCWCDGGEFSYLNGAANQTGATAVEALAKMYLYLKSNNLL